MSPVSHHLSRRFIAAAAACSIIGGACAGASDGETLRSVGGGQTTAGDEPAADPPAEAAPDDDAPNNEEADNEAPDPTADDAAVAADDGSDPAAEPEPDERVPEGPNELPQVAMIDIATGDEVTLSDFAPSDTPIVLWFWAPH